jgi:chromosome segregation protein
MSDLEKRVEELEKRVKKIKKEKKMIKKIFKCIFGDNKSSNNNTKELKNEIKTLNQELKELKKDKDILEKQLNQAKNRIINQEQELESFKREIEELKREKQSLRRELNNYKHTIINQNQEIESLKNEIIQLKESNKLSKLKELYNSLSDTSKEGLVNTLKGDDELSLFASASINFESLWEYAKYLNQEHKDRDFKILKEILEIIFNAIKDVQNYQKQDIKVGESFDMDKMVRDNRSTTQSGKVKEIVLFGYIKRGKIKQKAIVKVA